MSATVFWNCQVRPTPPTFEFLAKPKIATISSILHHPRARPVVPSVHCAEKDKSNPDRSMRAQAQKVFLKLPRDKQTMMFSATLSKNIREVIKKFMHKVA
jgi:hypothetical protein